MLDISPAENEYIIFKDRLTDLEYIRKTEEIYYRGFDIHLYGYQHFIFSDFRKMHDEKNLLADLNAKLNRDGVPSIEAAVNGLKTDNLYDAFNKILDPTTIKMIGDIIIDKESIYNTPGFLSEIKNLYSKILDCIVYYWGYSKNHNAIVCDFVEDIELLGSLNQFYSQNNYSNRDSHKIFLSNQTDRLLIFYWVLTHNLGKLKTDDKNFYQYSIKWLKEWDLSSLFNVVLLKSGSDDINSKELLAVLPVLIDQENWYTLNDGFELGEIVRTWMENEIIKEYLVINVYDNITWFNKERFDSFTRWMKIMAIVNLKKRGSSAAERSDQIKKLHTIFDKLQSLSDRSEYKVEKLLSLLNSD